MNRITTRREKMIKRDGSLWCCLTVSFKVTILMLTCFEELGCIVVITPAPLRLFNNTAGENCSDVLDGLPKISVAPASIKYIGTYPRPWINRTHEIFATTPPGPQLANMSDLSTERDVLFTEKQDFLKQTKQNQTLSTGQEDPTTTTSSTYEDKYVTEIPFTSPVSKLNPTPISVKSESVKIYHIENTFKTNQTPYVPTSIPNLKPVSSKTDDTSYSPPMTTQTFIIKQTFPKKKHASSVHGKIRILNQTQSLNLKKSLKLSSKVIDTPSKNSLLTNSMTKEHSPKNYGIPSKYSALPSNSNLILQEKKSSVSGKPPAKHITPKINEINRTHSSNSTEKSITTSGAEESLTVTSIFDIITDFTSALGPLFFSKKSEKPLTKTTNSSLSKQSPELLNSLKKLITHSKPLNSSKKLNIPSHKTLYTLEQLNTTSELLNSSEHLNTPHSELLNSSQQVHIPELLNSSVQLTTPSPQSLNSSDQLSIASPQILNSSVQLSTPSPQSLNSSDQLSIASPQTLNSSVQLSTPSPQSLNSSEQLSAPSPESLNSSYASIKKAEPIDPRSLEKELNSVLASRLPLALDPDLLYLWRAPYLQRLRHSNHEMVDVILQSEVRTPPESSECPNEYQRIVLLNLQRMLGLLLLTLPQSLKEVEEVMWDPDLENYLFRPQGKSILDVTTCKGSCYTMDSQGICREIFFCKDGTAPGIAPRLTPEQLRKLLAASNG